MLLTVMLVELALDAEWLALDAEWLVLDAEWLAPGAARVVLRAPRARAGATASSCCRNTTARASDVLRSLPNSTHYFSTHRRFKS